jgi:hypothetical protein
LQQLLLSCGTALDFAPEWRSQNLGDYLYRQVMFTHEQVNRISDNLGIGLHGAVIAKLLQVAPVYAVRRNLPVMHHRPVQDTEGVGAAHHYASLDEVPIDSKMLVVLDGVEDPHNLGAIIRTAYAAGAASVIIPDVGIQNPYRSSIPIRIGDLQGNRFDLIVRDIASTVTVEHLHPLIGKIQGYAVSEFLRHSTLRCNPVDHTPCRKTHRR